MSDSAHRRRDPAGAVPDDGTEGLARDQVRRALDEDPPDRERPSYRAALILKLRYGLTDGIPRTQDEVGDVFGITKQRVSQVERDSLRALGLGHLRPGRCLPAEPEPGYELLASDADLADYQDQAARGWYDGAWRQAELRELFRQTCEVVLDMGEGRRPVQTRLPVIRIAIATEGPSPDVPT